MTDPSHSTAGPVPRPRWRGTDYVRASAHHRAADDWFLRRHPPREHDIVVDLGCGTGEFTARLAALVRSGRVTGIDPDASMLAAARRHVADNLTFVQAAAENVDQAVSPRSVDLVVSRAMLHWLPAEVHSRLYDASRRVLRPGGVFHLEAAAPGNIMPIVDLLTEVAERHGIPAPPSFPEPATALELLEAAGFAVADDSVRSVVMRRRFTRGQLTALLTKQAALVLTRHTDPATSACIEDEVLDGVDRLRRRDGSWDQTFVRLELLVRRPC